MRADWIRSRFPSLAWVAVGVVALHVLDDAWRHGRADTSAGHDLVLLLPAVLLAALWALLATHVRAAFRRAVGGA